MPPYHWRRSGDVVSLVWDNWYKTCANSVFRCDFRVSRVVSIPTAVGDNTNCCCCCCCCCEWTVVVGPLVAVVVVVVNEYFLNSILPCR